MRTHAYRPVLYSIKYDWMNEKRHFKLHFVCAVCGDEIIRDFKTIDFHDREAHSDICEVLHSHGIEQEIPF